MHYHCAITTYCDELPQLLYTLLEYKIQLTTYLLPCELLSRLLRYVSGLGFRVPPLTTQTAYEPLSATSRTSILPFLIPVNWAGFVVRSAPPVTLYRLALPLRALEPIILSTTPSVTVTSTGLISERYLAVVSRLA